MTQLHSWTFWRGEVLIMCSSCSKLPAVKCTWAGEACPMSRKKNKQAFPYLLQHSVGHENQTSQCKYTDRKMGWETGWKTCSVLNTALTRCIWPWLHHCQVKWKWQLSEAHWFGPACHNNLHHCGTVLYPPTGTELLNQWSAICHRHKGIKKPRQAFERTDFDPVVT